MPSVRNLERPSEQVWEEWLAKVLVIVTAKV
jgi:hypothetical protein